MTDALDSSIDARRRREASDLSRESWWKRIAQTLSDDIRSGVYAPGSRLPSENELAARYGVHRHTIRRSIASLSQEGLVRVLQGSGSYVEEFALDIALSRRARHSQNMKHAGTRGALHVVAASRQRASADVASALRIPRQAMVVQLQVIGEGGGQPLHASSRWFPLPRFADIERVVRESGSLTEAFRVHGVHDYTREESRISAQMPDELIATLLRQPMTRPCLFVSSVNIDPQGVPIEYARTWFAGDRVKLTVRPDED